MASVHGYNPLDIFFEAGLFTHKIFSVKLHEGIHT